MRWSFPKSRASPRLPRKCRSPDAEEEAKKRKAARRTRAIVAVVVVAILAAAAIGVTYSLELWGGKTVPDVSGEAQAGAMRLLGQRDLPLTRRR